MALHVIALPPKEFEDWLARQAQPAAQPAGALMERGRAAFLEKGCQSCHTIRGVAGHGRLGPDLTHVGSRMQIGAGTLRTHQGTLAGWIADPQAIKPGVFMPGADMDGESLRALAAWLEQLR
jgi:cytochrome c oxidase subunit 2